MSPDRMYHVTREKYGGNKGFVPVMEPEGSQIVTAVPSCHITFTAPIFFYLLRSFVCS